MKKELASFRKIKNNLKSPEFYKTDDRLAKCTTMSNLIGLWIFWICPKLHNIGVWGESLELLKNTVWEVNKDNFKNIYVITEWYFHEKYKGQSQQYLQ